MIATLACTSAGAVLDAAAVAQPAGVGGVKAHTARPARRPGHRRRRNARGACRASASRGARKARASCRSHTTRPAGSHATHPGGSHPARERSTTHAHSDRRKGTSATPASHSTPSTGASIASVLATPCENTELTPEPDNVAEIEAATLCLVNQERARNDELPLAPNAQLQQAAQGHSEEMVADDYFAHVSPSGLTPVGRIQATGYIPNSQVGYTIGENIAWGTLQLSTPSSIVAAWIASPEHLANILYAPYRDTGVGVVAAVPASLGEGQPGAMYSQEFGVIVE